MLRILAQLGIGELEEQSYAEMERLLSAHLTTYLASAKKEALAEWKKRVSAWGPSSKALYKFLKNPEPLQTVVLQTEQGQPTNDPRQLHACLERFWAPLESWESEGREEKALEALEDKYSAFLPRQECWVRVTPELMAQLSKKLKPSSPGPDSWTRQELASLPLPAWKDLLTVLEMPAAYQTLVGVFRRVPIAKKREVEPVPASFRPIDVYSLLIRLYATATYTLLKPWLHEVLHEAQLAPRGRHSKGPSKTCVYGRTSDHWETGVMVLEC